MVEGRHVELCLRTTYQRVKPRLHSILFRGVQGKHLGAGFLMSKTASVIPEKHFEGIQASDGMQSKQSCYLSTTSHPPPMWDFYPISAVGPPTPRIRRPPTAEMGFLSHFGGGFASVPHPPLKWETPHIWGVSYVHGGQRPISPQY